MYNIWNAVWDFLKGDLKLAPREVASNRRNICNNCVVRNTTLNTCTICGCYLPFKTKLKNSTCPMDNW